MYERLAALYQQGKLTEAGLDNAVTRGWITEDQKQEILGAREGTTSTA